MNKIRFEQESITPSKVVCIGRNFVAHIKELQNEIPSSMVIFNKPNSAITHKLHFIEKECHYESEISFLIKESKIVGVAIGLDLTKRDLQAKLKAKGLPWERAKAFDNSALFSDFVKIAPKDIDNIELRLYINNNLQQKATTSLMIYKPNEIIEEINSFMSLNDGDIVMSGTPKGVGTYDIEDCFRGELYINEKKVIQKEWVCIV